MTTTSAQRNAAVGMGMGMGMQGGEALCFAFGRYPMCECDAGKETQED